jgi:hypothetical protein
MRVSGNLRVQHGAIRLIPGMAGVRMGCARVVHGVCILGFLNPALTKPRQFGRMLTHRTLIPTILLLAACGAQPAPEFFGATRTDVVRDGRNYTVFHKDNRVEVIRQGYATRGQHQAIRATMIDLIPAVTGCKLVESSLQGDSGEMRGSIRC